MEHHYRTVVEPALLRPSSPSPSSCAAPSLFTQLQRIPKTDFHCHLNGSITPALLAHMERLVLHERRRHQATDAAAGDDDDDDDVEHAEELANPTEEESDLLFFNTQEKRMQNVLASPTGNEPAAAVPGSSSTRSTPKDRMNYCFTVFDAIYKIMTNLAFTRLAVQDMLVCSAAENIFVMEVRTSLRDGLMRTFRTSAAKRKKEEGEEEGEGVVLKQTYVDTVVETVEHLLSGGLVDFMTGELLPLDTSAAILATHSNSTNSAAGDADEAAAARRWWAVYDRVYGSLLLPESPPLTPPPQQEQEEGKKEHETSPSSLHPCDKEANQKHQQQQEEKKNASRLFFVQRVSFNLMHRMHVRLLLSVNRAAPESAAWEAARLTTDTQQLQVRAFHAWCRRCSSDRVDGPTAAADVLAKLRRTCWVTGMDLSGNCYRGLYTTFNAALAAARWGSASSATATLRSELQGPAAWLRTTAAITLHGGEKVDEEELSAMVAFDPERWGHLVFTDDVNLSTILAAQQGIELCLTSNLLTSGHADVAEHHLGHLLELWDSMKESRVVSSAGEEEEEKKAPGECEGGGSRSDAPAALLRRGSVTATASATYRATEQARLARRLLCATRRWEHADAPSHSSSSSPPSSRRGLVLPPPPHAQAGGVAILPNVSFHTDDRGVFGTTLTDELLLASQHTGVGRMAALLTETEKAKTTTTNTLIMTSDVAVAAAQAVGTEALWMLERLSLLQIFELPLPVQLLAVLLTEKMSGGAASDKEEEGRSARCECGRAVLTQWEHITAQTPSTWGDWDSFAAVCEQVLSHKPSAGGRGVPELLSAWEVAWLTEEFDRYW